MKRRILVLLVRSVITATVAIDSGVAEEVGAVIHPNESFDVESTVVWSPVFQSAWDAMNRHMGKLPIEAGNELMESLDSFDWDSKEVMPEGHWKSWAGPSTKAFVREVNREAASLAGEGHGPFEERDGPTGSVAFYGFLDRELSFNQGFYRSKKSGLVFHGADRDRKLVDYWGVRGALSGGFSSSVRVLHHDIESESHALELECTPGGDESVILFMPAGRSDFSEACKKVRTWRSRWTKDFDARMGLRDPWLHRLDQIRVPYLDLKSKVDAKGRLKGSRIYQADGLPWAVSRAEQQVAFLLHEKGARVRAAVAGELQPFGEAPKPPRAIPRDFTFDRPFFVFVWRSGAEWPYFGAWVGSTEAMTEFKK